ncbi:MAG TPA: glycosyltransferase [Verrucomicrobiales bacterium]|nr:glycosyltransferase [Verrucomicrobiales bacterium]
MIKVALVHYHLRPGGVSRVLENTLAALHSGTRCRAVVLCGESPVDAPWVRQVPGLGYLEQPGPLRAGALAQDLVRAAEETLGGTPSVWHVHNPNLGKNVLLPRTLELLAQSGQRLLLHMHDFAEDGRPRNHALLRNRGPRFPQGVGVHYAAVNRRDAALLQQAGIPAHRIHYLPNPVHLPFRLPPPDERRRSHTRKQLWFYPTRGIRRKNLGETVLLGLLGGAQLAIATSRGPGNPSPENGSQAWGRAARTWAPNVRFAVSGRLAAPSPFPQQVYPDPCSFEAWLSAADAILTTSVAEGFGLAFLESSLLGLPLVGRDLPAVTRDFAASGIRAPLLYERLDVPLSWIGERTLRQRIGALIRDTFRAYQIDPPPAAFEEAWAAMIPRGAVDFGNLPEDLQESIIERAAAEPLTGTLGSLRIRISESGDEVALGDWIAARLSESPDASLASQREIVERNFGLAAFAERLEAAYTALLQDEIIPCSSACSEDVERNVLRALLQPRHLHFLRSGLSHHRSRR